MNEYVIVGAGIAGLSLARVLSENGKEVLLLDKGRGVGGRVATRRVSEAYFDHGAQYFTCRSKEFQHVIDGGLKAGAIKEWKGVFKENDYPRYIGTQGINSLPKFLASDLRIVRGCRITELSQNESGWMLGAQDGKEFETQNLILTPPLPQTLSLLSQVKEFESEHFKPLAQVEYSKCIAALIRFEKELSLPDEVGGIKFSKDSPFSWIANNEHKNGEQNQGCLTIHCSYDFSEKYFEEDEEKIRALVLEELTKIIPNCGSPIFFQLQRWRYAEPKSIVREHFLLLQKSPLLALAGEVFHGPKIEGAFLSGYLLGLQLLGR